jgi:dienelactone hydrolase
MRIVFARRLTREAEGIPGYAAHPDGPGPRPGMLLVHHAHGITGEDKIDAYELAKQGFNVLAPSLFNISDAHHGFRHPDNEGHQPHYAELAWPLVTGFLGRVL